MNTVKTIVLSLGMLVAFSTSAMALTTFFGEDLNYSNEGTRLTSYPNALAARNSFLSNLSGVGTEDFESYADGTLLPLNISFPGSTGSITATLAGNGYIMDLPGTGTSAGRYPISGDNFLQEVYAGSSTTALTITFSSPVAAFGFYGTDFGDFNGITQLVLQDGTTVTVPIGNSTGIQGGATLFFGVIDTLNTFTSIVFQNTNPSGGDYFGFDDMTIGDAQQVVPSVPEPSTFILLGAGLAGIGLLRRKARK